jgi:hypothetical protein
MANWQGEISKLSQVFRDFVWTFTNCKISCFDGLEVASAGFTPGGSRRTFRAKKFLCTLSFGEEVKPSVPCRSFTACKRSLNVRCMAEFRQNYRTFLAQSCIFRRWVLSRGHTRGDAWWRKLERLTKVAQ